MPMAADAHTVALLDQKTFIGNRRMVPATLTVTNYNSTTGSIITPGEVGFSRITQVIAYASTVGFEPWVSTVNGYQTSVHLRAVGGAVEVAGDTNVSTTAPIAANLLVFGV